MTLGLLLVCAAAQAADMPTPGTRWRYSFRDLQYYGTRQFYSVTAVEVEGARVRELLVVEGGEIRESTVEAARLRFVPRVLNDRYTVLELAPYGLDRLKDVQGAVAEMYPRLREVDWKLAPAERAEEQISVPAGAFQTIRVRVTGVHPAFGMAPQDAISRPGRFEYTVWYAPAVSRTVKVRHRFWDRAHSPLGDQVAELASYEPAATPLAKPAPIEMPSAGTTWKYGYSDARFRAREGYFTVEAATVEGTSVRERWTGEGGEIIQTDIDARAASFVVKRFGSASVLELAPYTREPRGLARAALSYPHGEGGQWKIDPPKSSEESMVVRAGTFATVRVDLAGRALPMANTATSGRYRFLYTIWYAPELKRYVKSRHQTWNQFGNTTGDEIVELIEYQPGRGAPPAGVR